MDFDAKRTALVLIDLMPRIIDMPTGPRSGREVLATCLRLAGALREAGSLVVFVRVERPNVEEQPPGSELAPECDPRPDDVVIVKRTIGAFHCTGLDKVLRERGIATLVLGGLVTNFGVEGTGRSAIEYGYDVIYVEDAMAGFDAAAHEFAVTKILPKLGEVTTSAELLRSEG